MDKKSDRKKNCALLLPLSFLFRLRWLRWLRWLELFGKWKTYE
jgi:hypothetical protein